MSWYRTGTVTVTNGSKTVTGVGTLWTTAVNAGDAFALVDANLNPTGAWYEVESVTNNTTLVLKQSYAGSTGSNKQYCVFNLVGNMTTPSFAQRLATFFASFQSLIDKPTTTPTASSIPVADSGGKIADGWIPATVARLASPTLTGTPTAPTAAAGTKTTQVATTAFVNTGIASTGLGPTTLNKGPTDANTLVTPGFWGGPGDSAVNWGIAQYGWMVVSRRTTQVLQIAIDHVGRTMELRSSPDTGATWGDWYRQYSQYTILGTVSQSGGVPTGAVIERGSNANGEYVKFADGTMICTGVYTASNYSSTAYGQVFSTVVDNIPFPATFIAAPSVTCDPKYLSGYRLWSPVHAPNKTYFGAYVFSYNAFSAVTFDLFFIAIGRWF